MHSCQCLQADLALAKESGDRKEKMLARRSKGRLLHMVDEKREVFSSKGWLKKVCPYVLAVICNFPSKLRSTELYLFLCKFVFELQNAMERTLPCFVYFLVEVKKTCTIALVLLSFRPKIFIDICILS
ncbi:hypothetical protein IC575_017932 [Cucumis melo]